MSKQLKYLLAVISGILYSFTFTTVWNGYHFPEMGYLAFVCLVPLFVAILNGRPKEAFWVSFVSLFVGYAFANFWIYNAMHTYGNLAPLLCLLVMAITFTLMSLYVGLACFLACWISDAIRGQTTFFACPAPQEVRVACPPGTRKLSPVVFLLPLFWTLQDFCRNYWPIGGYPWSNIAYSQHKFLSLIQFIDITGIYGLTALIIFVNAVLAKVVIFFVSPSPQPSPQRERGPIAEIPLPLGERIKERGRVPWRELATAVVIFAAVITYGVYREGAVEGLFKGEEPYKFAMLQGNIPQDEKWLSGRSIFILERHIGMAKEAVDAGADFVIWPEASYPYNVPFGVRRLGFIREFEKPMLVGAVTYKKINRELRLNNSALMVEPGGIVTGKYDKNHLVPLGEYIPLKPIFGFIKKLVPVVGDMEPGNLTSLLKFNENPFGALICYEDIFPEIARTLSKNGARFLTNITNDAWYGDTSGPYQHVTFSQYRAIENRRFIVRATNTGISAAIDPAGRILETSKLDTQGIMYADVAAIAEKTFYTRFGEVFVCLSAGIAAVLFCLVIFRCRRASE